MPRSGIEPATSRTRDGRSTTKPPMRFSCHLMPINLCDHYLCTESIHMLKEIISERYHNKSTITNIAAKCSTKMLRGGAKQSLDEIYSIRLFQIRMCSRRIFKTLWQKENVSILLNKTIMNFLCCNCFNFNITLFA